MASLSTLVTNFDDMVSCFNSNKMDIKHLIHEEKQKEQKKQQEQKEAIGNREKSDDEDIDEDDSEDDDDEMSEETEETEEERIGEGSPSVSPGSDVCNSSSSSLDREDYHSHSSVPKKQSSGVKKLNKKKKKNNFFEEEDVALFNEFHVEPMEATKDLTSIKTHFVLKKVVTHVCPFDTCKRVFKRREHLKRHILTHTGEKPFRCPIDLCNRSFSRVDNLSQHLKTHSKSCQPDKN